jgi:hypothetical protein
MSLRSNNYASILRQELMARNRVFAEENRLPHVLSYGESPVVVYRSECGRCHGNFITASYRAILRRPEWRKRFEKVHTQAGRCLPAGDRPWCELDSSMSSDALLMNIFCYPRITEKPEVWSLLGIDRGAQPEFGFRPRVPLVSGAIERTEVDMKLGSILFEAKLTEGDFQTQRADLVEGYRDFKDVFEHRQLQTDEKRYVSYQLIRNVLAARALGLGFCALIDARRPDLMEDWYDVLRSIRPLELRARCKVLTWQELAKILPRGLQKFLDAKYGITPA